MHQEIEHPGVDHSAIDPITATGLIVPWALAGTNISYICAPELICASSHHHCRSSTVTTDPPTATVCLCVCGAGAGGGLRVFLLFLSIVESWVVPAFAPPHFGD